jgi:hypothetical protein
MKRLWISNIAPGTSDEEITTLVRKYAPDLDCYEVERVEGDGSRCGALLSFTHKDLDSMSAAALTGSVDAVVALLERLENLSRQLNGMYWKGRVLSSSTMILGATR